MFRALGLAFKNLVRKPVTRNYPAEKLPKAARYRGLVLWKKEKCISCFICEKACPPGAILFTQNVETGEVEFHLNPYLCIYCGECVRACPDRSNALTQSEELADAGISADQINSSWSALEISAADSKLKYRARKKDKK
ncbi:MAG TPA: hypothetical protein DCS07_10350 [Bdellovibrionales bacterium]|nr:MAG: hypothetical protein A2Z97_00945 [Bdellovibrionales bacterium GWB1_52_6]OFZ03089.1 MAG: hypothetical protein A2X97_09635 [Bdellovibrionales bacterium GWA1_52_35]OFZ37696.1 MAG: hypothetical protein A2070_13785 [Bdellovibrionales bacterium GWC1_52_8]HAR43011.1 hypothetical protein [Bdellovibrionales bacterium]HCM40417.1 hypothetical protein [Bdellovibrionales bacterium]